MATAKKKQIEHVDSEIGKRIRARRLMLDMSQTDLGNKLGITFQQIQKYEKGTNRVSGSKLSMIANVLKVTPGYFFESASAAPAGNGKGKAATNGSGDSELLALVDRADAVRLLKALKNVSGPRRAAIIHLAETCASSCGEA